MKQNNIISDAREGHFLHLLAYLGRRESHLNTMWKKLQTEPSLHQKVNPGAHCGALLASAGQLVAPSGLLFEVLFVTLGRYWGPPGPELHKDIQID